MGQTIDIKTGTKFGQTMALWKKLYFAAAAVAAVFLIISLF